MTITVVEGVSCVLASKSDCSDVMTKRNKKVQIPLFIVIPPMGSSTPRFVWCAGRDIQKLENNKTFR